LNSAAGLTVDNDGRLFISDTSNNRILIYPPIPSSTPTNNIAIDVIGQTDFGSNLVGQLNFPKGITFDTKYAALWVADTGNNRVLRFPFGVNVDNNATDVTVTFAGRKPDVTISPKGKNPFPLSSC
jgi:sugar lactone lactonase YvrE